MWLRALLNRRAYRLLTEDALRTRRKSDTVFVCGCGASLNAMSEDEWRDIAAHDVLGFNLFIYQHWVPTAFHLFRGGLYTRHRRALHRYASDTAQALNSNPLFSEAVVILQGEYLAEYCNRLLGYRLLQPGTPIFRYATARADGDPTQRLQDGVRHGVATLCDAVNVAYCLGWKRIVLVGVDLYDSRYFFLDPDTTLAYDARTGAPVKTRRSPIRGQDVCDVHNTARNGIVDTMGRWSERFAREGVELSVYNPKSLLADVLPVYQSTATRTSAADAERSVS